jgi:hypothetical protein
MKNKQEEIEESVMPPRFEKVEHKDLKLLSEANGLTLLQSVTTGKVYVVVRCSDFGVDGFTLKELKSNPY